MIYGQHHTIRMDRTNFNNFLVSDISAQGFGSQLRKAVIESLNGHVDDDMVFDLIITGEHTNVGEGIMKLWRERHPDDSL